MYTCDACENGVTKCVTKRLNRGNRCNSANNSRKPQKAHSKTESRSTSADQQHKNGSTRTRPQKAGGDKKHPTRGVGGNKRTTHTAPNSPECNHIKACDYTLTPGKDAIGAQRPQPQRRRRANSRRPKCYLAPGRHRQSRRHTNDTTTPTIHHAPHRGSLCGRAMLCPAPTRPSKKLRDHRRCSSGTRDAACAAQTCKDNTEQRARRDNSGYR